MSEEPQLLFVYGTLREGASHHHRLEDADLVGKAVAWGKMYRADSYPSVVLEVGGDMVFGEVYQASERLLRDLDRYEVSQRNRFRRVRTVVTFEADQGANAEVWIYEYKGDVEDMPPIVPADWLPPEERWPMFAVATVVLILMSTQFVIEMRALSRTTPVGVLPLVLQATSVGTMVLPLFAGWASVRRMERWRFGTEVAMVISLILLLVVGAPALVDAVVAYRHR